MRKKENSKKSIIKILCISDHKDPLVYSNSIKSRFSDIDFVISAGDLQFQYYDFIVSSLNKPLYFVFGNHHLKRIGDYKKKYDNKITNTFYSQKMFQPVGATYISGKIKQEKGLLIAGLGGCKWYNGKPNQYTEFGMFINIMKLIPGLLWNRIFHGRFLDILVTHAPPFGINDKQDRCHRGFKVFLWFLEKFKPKFHIHGHIHIYDRNSKREELYLNTRIINVYNHYILKMEKNNE
jgi:Icc-related predicted phosphoesterase